MYYCSRLRYQIGGLKVFHSGHFLFTIVGVGSFVNELFLRKKFIQCEVKTKQNYFSSTLATGEIEVLNYKLQLFSKYKDDIATNSSSPSLFLTSMTSSRLLQILGQTATFNTYINWPVSKKH